MLRVEHVHVSYPDGPALVGALVDVSLTVADGTFVAVMGPSGSGKTTLAMVAAGIERAGHGSVWFDDLDLSHASAAQRAVLRRRRIGVVFQRDNLDPVLSAEENVALPLRLDGLRPKPATDAARVALARCGIEDLAHRFPGQLSGGQRQRVAVARAVAGERTLIVADEPTASVDTITARGVVELLSRLAREGVSVLMTTHDSRLAAFADEVVFLRDGARVQGDAAAVG